MLSLACMFGVAAQQTVAQVEEEEVVEEEEAEPAVADLSSAPSALSTVPVPAPDNLREFVKNEQFAIALGKALFWDMQTGSDGKTACATCHFHAGADVRTKNTLYPGAPSGTFGAEHPGQEEIEEAADEAFFSANRINTIVDPNDFPFHKLANPHEKASSSNPVLRSSQEVVGSQGVLEKDFVGLVDGSDIDDGTPNPNAEYVIDGVNGGRNITVRNTPTTVNAAFFDRLFWDGRANRFFNGVNPFGDMDPDAKVWVYSSEDDSEGRPPHAERVASFDADGNIVVSFREGEDNSAAPTLHQTRICLDNGAMASQAVGPPLSEVEMSWNGRSFPELGRKLLSLRPLARQRVHFRDSVLGPYADWSGRGLQVKYATLIRNAFHRKWWAAPETTPEGYTQMEANFSLFWGLAIQMYESTLISDDSPYDRWASGDESALSDDAKEGLKLFLNEGKCINCHGGPEFAGATVSDLRPLRRDDSREPESAVEFMQMQRGPEAFYDSGFYNIGVRPTLEDLGLGSTHPDLGPLSYTRRVQQGQSPKDLGTDVSVAPGDRVAVDGAFKTPTLRNIELTGPYMHTGGMKNLTEVVQFYARRSDFFHENIDDLDPDVDGIDEVRGDDEKVRQLVAFLKSLTDDRVRYQKAPFDHPELVLPNGHSGVIADGDALDESFVLPAVGQRGGAELKSFEEIISQ